VALKKTNGHIEDLRIGLTAVNPAPILVNVGSLKEEVFGKELAEAAGELAARTAKPLTTSALTPEYRREMIRVFTAKTVLAICSD
jgi:CO/xanthine dehydrogenase FAD-binding subunit